MKSSSRQSPEPQPRFGRDERDFVLRVAMKLLKNEDDAEDAAQDAMLQAFRHRANFRGDAKFTTWLYRVAVTASLMHLRKQGRRETRAGVDTLDACATLPAPGPDPEARTIAAAQLVRAGRHLAQMSPISGKVFRLNAEGYTSREISTKLSIKVSTVKMRVDRDRLRLRAALDRSAPALDASPLRMLRAA